MNATPFKVGLGGEDIVDLSTRSPAEVWEYLPNRGAALTDVRGATLRVVEAPSDFPAISQAIVEGDKVALAVDANVPDVDQVIAGVIDAIPQATVGELVVLLSDEAIPDTVRRVEAVVAERGAVKVHDPEQRDQLGYLAANAAADPIYLHRSLIDADLVIPIITARPAGALDPHVMDGGVMPAFADAETQRRLRSETLEAGGADDREASEAAWLLGIQFLVAVLPTAEAGVARVLAGTPAGVRREAEHAIAASWQRDTSRKADLVFACLDGSHQQQSWENVARALHVARHLVNPGGTIVITSHIAKPLGKSLRRLAGSDGMEGISRRLAKDHGHEALTASLLLQLRQEGRVLLMSDIAADEIESIGIGAIEDVDGLRRLVDAHDTCAIIRAAQFCGIGPAYPSS